MSATLLPCPFCGEEAEIERPGTARQSMIVACTNCGCRVESGDVCGLTLPESWKWNLREEAAEIARLWGLLENLTADWFDEEMRRGLLNDATWADPMFTTTAKNAAQVCAKIAAKCVRAALTEQMRDVRGLQNL